MNAPSPTSAAPAPISAAPSHSVRDDAPENDVITRQALLDAFEGGGTLGELRGLERGTADIIYALAAARVAEGSYAEAERFLRFLCVHRHDEPDFWLALARTLSLQGHRRRAIGAYLIVALTRPGAALSLEMAHLYLAGDETERATECLENAATLIPDAENAARLQDEHDRLAQRLQVH